MPSILTPETSNILARCLDLAVREGLNIKNSSAFELLLRRKALVEQAYGDEAGKAETVRADRGVGEPLQEDDENLLPTLVERVRYSLEMHVHRSSKQVTKKGAFFKHEFAYCTSKHLAEHRKQNFAK